MVDQKLTCVAFIWMGIWPKKAKFRNVLDRKKKTVTQEPSWIITIWIGALQA